MDKIPFAFFSFLFQLISIMCFGQKPGNYDAIYSGTPWFDQNGKVVSAHAANIIKEKDKFYLFGEAHTDTSNAFVGFNCYSSKDLYNWKFEKVALPLQPNGKLGPNRVGERPKVLKCPKTGEFIMFMHVDTLGYKDQFVGYAVANNITGPYTFKGTLLFNNKPIKKWDMGVFQDSDGAGYVLTHGGQIHRLADDYKSAISLVSDSFTSGFESPTMLKKNGVYFFIGSNLTSWEKNDNYYYTATALKGPWISRGLIAPKGKLTWNSQSTYVLAISGTKDTTFMYMGDRWSYPKQASSASYVWQPLKVTGTSLALPDYQEAWQINLLTGKHYMYPPVKRLVENTSKEINFSQRWQHLKLGDTLSESRSDAKDASFSVSFTGRQIWLYSNVQTANGYASVKITDIAGKVCYASIIDMYSNFPQSTPVFVSPLLPKNSYKLTVSVTGERPNWSDKKKTNYGSTSHAISLDKLVIVE